MTTKRLLGAFALAFAVGVPRPVAADSLSSIDLGVQCTPGAFRACASMSIWTALNDDGGTSVFASVSNVQGAPGFEALPPAALVSFQIGGLSLDLQDCEESSPYGCETPFDLESRLGRFGSGSREEVVTLGGDVSFYEPAFAEGVGEQHFAFDGAGGKVGYTFMDSESWYYGCDFPEDPVGKNSFSFCNGGFDFEFNVGTGVGLGVAEQSYVELSFLSGPDPAVRCSTAGGASDPCFAVPEPTPGILVAMGLLGLLGFRRRDPFATD